MTLRRSITICALIAAMSVAGCRDNSPKTPTDPNHPSYMSKVQYGEKYDFNMVMYGLKLGVPFDTSELGKFLGSQEITWTPPGGRPQPATFEFYDCDGNKYPDAIILREGDGKIAAIGLDGGSAHYGELKSTLGDRVYPVGER